MVAEQLKRSNRHYRAFQLIDCCLSQDAELFQSVLLPKCGKGLSVSLILYFFSLSALPLRIVDSLIVKHLNYLRVYRFLFNCFPPYAECVLREHQHPFPLCTFVQSMAMAAVILGNTVIVIAPKRVCHASFPCLNNFFVEWPFLHLIVT